MRKFGRVRVFKLILLGLIGISLQGCSTQSSTPEANATKQGESSKVADSDSGQPSEVAVPDEPLKNDAESELASEEMVAPNNKPKLASAGYQFESPVRVEAEGEPISVEAPGYACPTMADVDGDGKLDLVVGQFKDGNMQFCKNIAGENEMPKFAKPQWLMTGDKRTVVPGVW